MSDHIFEILGIGSREDSYTDLIHYAFENNAEFKKKLLKLLNEQNFNDWKAITRPSVTIVSETGRKKDVPDLIIFSKKAYKILLIENKVFSGEGWKQTERYSSDDFKNSLTKDLVEKEKMVENPKFKFIFLTLYGKKPSSNNFLTKSYKDIANCIPQTLSNTKLDILLTELKERINEYENWPLPKENDVVLNYLHNTNRLINSYRTFTIMSKNLIDTKNVPVVECSITANRGSGYIPLCIWQKDEWKGEKDSTEKSEQIDGRKCFDIHFELQWDTRKDNESITLYLHYHTNPYKTRSEFEKLNEIFKNSYKNNRDEFFNFVKKNCPSLWNISKTSLRIALYKFDNDIKHGALKEKVNALISSMTPIIDDYLGKL